MAQAWIALGSNLGDPAAQLRSALQRIGEVSGVKLEAVSSFYRSAPLGPAGQADYCNAVCQVSTDLAPLELLRALQRIEDTAGRDRSGPRWGARTLDLDVLLYDAQMLDTPELKLPHPELYRRNFVLAPLAEIAPTLTVPGRGEVRQLLGAAGREGLASW